MPYTQELPCVRCGRPVAAPTTAPLPTCARCLGGAGPWEVRVGAERLRLDAAGLRARLLAGTLAGTDTILDGATATPIAAHPAFRAWFLPGHPDALAPVARPPTPAPAPVASGARPGRSRALLYGLGAVALVGAIAAAIALRPPAPAPPAPPAPEQALGAAVAPPVEAPPEALPPPARVDPMDALLDRVGDVAEPRAALLAEAWARRNEGSADGLAAAVVAAERAVARTPKDPEALALLASLYAESGAEPELRVVLADRARATAPTAPASRRGAAFVALAGGDAPEARKLAEDCLRDVPGDLGCREALAAALAATPVAKAAEAENQLYTLDELARAWPENRTLGRRAALLGAAAEVVGAEKRLDAEAKRAPKDAALLTARALLAFRNGASSHARALLAQLDAPPPALLLEAAGDALGRGDLAGARKRLGQLPTPLSRDALLYDAQLTLLEARAGKATPAQALAAADRLAALDPGHPAAVQVRVSAAVLAGDTAAAARAWDALQPKGAASYDLARAWLARAALDLGQNHPREALLAADTALQADRSEPDAFLWKAAATATGQNGPAAVEALRGAVAAIDGRHTRRRPYGGALATPADAPKLQAAIQQLLAGDPARQDDLAVGTAVLRWLTGDLDAALGAVEPVAARGSDADALALKARLLLAKGQAAGALAAIDQALALRPKEMAWQLVRAEVLLGVGRAAEAESALASARSGTVPASTLQLLVARVAAKKGDTAAALVARRAAAAADPADLVARRALRGVTED